MSVEGNFIVVLLWRGMPLLGTCPAAAAENAMTYSPCHTADT